MDQNNKRIAKNTLILYIRMLLTMVVTLYTSRIVLQTLGVVDFGLYSVVGGVVTMFGFLNASMSGATSRFLTYEIGRNDSVKLKETFSSALIVHCGIGIIVFLLAESLGLWFLEKKMIIPIERMDAVRFVYQASVFTAIVTITQVPYNASIIAHEKMDVYAYVEILNVSLKLLIVFLLLIGNIDKLIYYAALVLAVSTLIAFIYRIYCLRHFQECKFKWVWKPELVKPMLFFSGWDLYGNASTIARVQGVNMLLNMFFGAVLNAASGIASSVQAAVGSFAGNITMAVKPQIIKSYAAKDYARMISLVNNASKFTFLLLLFISLPLILEIDFILRLWLGVVPKYASVFCVYTLLFNFFSTMSYVVVTAIHATGNIKRPSIINGTLYLAVLPIAYIAYKLGAPPEISYAYNIFAVVCGMLSNVWTIHLCVKEFSFANYLKKVFLNCIFVMILSFLIVYSFQFFFPEEGWTRLLCTLFVSIVVVSILGFYISMNEEMRRQSLNFIKSKLCKKA